MPPSPSEHAGVFTGLHPEPVWRHFSTLCRIPRPSKAEGPLRDFLLDWARARALEAQVDGAGNLIVRKPASAGYESAPGIVLQAHLDMVCQANAGTLHDFSRDPIRPERQDGWLVAPHTTLGADNGIGVALILATLEERSLRHGPLEALLTVDEEAGMGGAQGLSQDLLQGRRMLNLDTEDWGEFYLGCAGGLDINVSRPGQPVPRPADHDAWSITLTGLRGGHSGVDIHEERGNAIKLLVRVLKALETPLGLRLSHLSGGTARNALPREAQATILVPRQHGPQLEARLKEWQSILIEGLEGVDPGLRLTAQPAGADTLLSALEQAVWLDSLQAAPHGVKRWSRHLPGVVETSNNLGMIRLTPDGGQCNLMVRSLREDGSQALADEILSLFALSGTQAEATGHYPGWTPNPDSPLLALCQGVFLRDFGGASAVKVIHAGLECGLIHAKYPDMDIVSFGPTIRGAHAPGERVDIQSVGNAWRLLTAILAEQIAPD